MGKKLLHIVESAYRATLEEQDDTIVWFTHIVKGNGADVDVLLRGNAVNYAVEGHDASGLSFGARRQTRPPKLDQDVVKLASKGVKVFIVQEDLVERGLVDANLISGLESVSAADLPKLFSAYDHVFHW